ncbi:hypothetical protein AB0P19_06890 [Microbacterium oleivorans]|uniref:hypothetical protein n=1 Tax=Microbacterium oleivorans TaxID=273677 RepID=UPI0033EE125A
MANKKITDLTAKTTAGATDIIPIVDPGDNTTKRTTVGGLITALLSVIPGGSIVTAMLANNAVTAGKIDFSSLPFKGADGLSTTNTATTYGNLSSSVSMTVDVPSTGKVALIMSARLFNTTTSDQTGYVSFAASGANTIAATDANAIAYKVLSGNADASFARVKNLTGLTPGSTTFTLQRRTTGGSLQVINADLIVIPMS